ncbi:MAG: exo-alpha-sialidase [Thermoplasmata archaeon]|nr:exo-alpha-sialidase [Thermoplasmata archaeon]
MKGKILLVGLVAFAMLMPALPGNAINKESGMQTEHVNVKFLYTITSSGMGNVQVTNAEENEHNPSIGMDPTGKYYIAYTKDVSVFENKICGAYSSDGTTWNNMELFPDMEGLKYGNQVKFDTKSNLLVGVFAAYTSGYNIVYTIPDASDPSNWQAGGFTGSGNTEHTYSSIMFTDLQDGTHIGVVPFISDSGGYTQTGNWLYVTLNPLDFYGQYVYYDAQSVIGEYTASSIRGANWGDNVYGVVIGATNGETGRQDVIVKWTTYEAQPDIEYVDNQFWIMKDTEHDAVEPDIAANGNDIYIVYSANTNLFGDYDVICYYSHDGGATWETSTPAGTSGADEKHPAIYAQGNNVYVAYVNTKEHNLYLVKSTDGGATWSEPEKINDADGSVADMPGAVAISSAGIVWTDTRNGNQDIYYAQLPAPRIVIKSVSGGMGVKAVIANEGSEDASNIGWSIDATGGLIILGKHAEGTIDSLAAGQETTISSGLMLGIGPVTVTINAGGASATAKGFLLGPLLLGLK